MRPELETYHQIDLFLKGELTGTDLSAFEKRMLEDGNFAEEVDLQKQVHQVVEHAVYQDIRQQMKFDIQRMDQNGRLKKKISYGVGLLILMMIFGIYLFMNTPLSVPQKTEQKESTISLSTVPAEKLTSPNQTLDNTSVIDPKTPTIEKAQQPASPIKKVERKENVSSTEVISTPLVIRAPEKLHPHPNHVPLPATSAVPEAMPADCKEFKLEVKPQVEAACMGEASGKVLFHAGSIKGGNSPYLIGTEPTNKKMQEHHFNHLSGGEHVFFITDSKGCSEAMHVLVPEEQCKENKFVLNIAAGESWQIPAVHNDFILTVLDRSGRIVYKQKSEDIYQQQWNGMNLNGGFLDSGLYIYMIEYSDGKKQSGQVSIVK